MARRSIWWMHPEEAVLDPDRVIAQVMELGDYDDVMALRRQVGDGRLRRVLLDAPAGRFSPRSWNYWQLRLGLAQPGAVPPPPVRRFAET